MTKILFLVLHRKDRSPGQRYRHEQYLDYLKSKGMECTFSPLLSEKEDRIFYSEGNLFSKSVIGLKALLKRLRDVFRAHKFDFVYIYRDAFFFGTFFERMMTKKGARIIYDFDDAIWLMDKNPKQGVFNLLKNPEKTARIIGLSDRIIVGNKYLKEYAEQFSKNVLVIPSTINMDHYNIKKEKKDRVCIGWTGSFSTVKHFETVIPALESIKNKYGDQVYFKVIGDPNYNNRQLDIEGTKWKSESEARDLSELDIGLMPLPDDEWSRGKCAMKGLQYMALSIPTIMSPVGVNKDIVIDGVNGMLASTTEEWIIKLSELIENPTLRKEMGDAGKKTVEKDFSTAANRDKWLAVFQD